METTGGKGNDEMRHMKQHCKDKLQLEKKKWQRVKMQWTNNSENNKESLTAKNLYF